MSIQLLKLETYDCSLSLIPTFNLSVSPRASACKICFQLIHTAVPLYCDIPNLSHRYVSLENSTVASFSELSFLLTSTYNCPSSFTEILVCLFFPNMNQTMSLSLFHPVNRFLLYWESSSFPQSARLCLNKPQLASPYSPPASLSLIRDSSSQGLPSPNLSLKTFCSFCFECLSLKSPIGWLILPLNLSLLHFQTGFYFRSQIGLPLCSTFRTHFVTFQTFSLF